MERAASSAAPQNSTQYRQVVIIERNVDQIDVKDLPLYEIPDNDIRLAAGRQGIFRAGKQILRVINVHLQRNRERQDRILAGMVGRVIPDL